MTYFTADLQFSSGVLFYSNAILSAEATRPNYFAARTRCMKSKEQKGRSNLSAKRFLSKHIDVGLVNVGFERPETRGVSRDGDSKRFE